MAQTRIAFFGEWLKQYGDLPPKVKQEMMERFERIENLYDDVAPERNGLIPYGFVSLKLMEKVDPDRKMVIPYVNSPLKNEDNQRLWEKLTFINE